MRVHILFASLLAFQSACWPFTAIFSKGAEGLRLKTTNIPANDENWAKLENATTQLGWTYTRGGSTEYRLKVKPSTGDGVLQMDYNRNSHTIDFNCAGDLKDSKKCTAAANKLFGPAFNIEVHD